MLIAIFGIKIIKIENQIISFRFELVNVNNDGKETKYELKQIIIC